MIKYNSKDVTLTNQLLHESHLNCIPKYVELMRRFYKTTFYFLLLDCYWQTKYEITLTRIYNGRNNNVFRFDFH